MGLVNANPSGRYTFIDEKVVDITSLALFDIVRDVEKYPDFIPWCSAVIITESNDDFIIADLLATFKGFKGKYTSKIICKKPENTQEGFIEAKAVKGIFKYLYSKWTFIPQEKNSTFIKFYIEFEFESGFLQSSLSTIFEHIQKKVIQSFLKRAHSLLKK